MKKWRSIMASETDPVPFPETVAIISRSNSRHLVEPKSEAQDHHTQLTEAAEWDAYNEANEMFAEIAPDLGSEDSEHIALRHAETVFENNMHAIREHMAEGKQFRKQFSKTEVADIALYLAENNRRIDAAWLIGFAQDEEMSQRFERQLHEIQRKGAAANNEAKERRRTEARAIYAGPNPETGRPWARKEDCIMYLMQKKGWSRAAINSYLPTKKGGA